MSQFLSTFLLATAIVLTICFGVAAWRISAGEDVEITGQILGQSYGWRTSPAK